MNASAAAVCCSRFDLKRHRGPSVRGWRRWLTLIGGGFCGLSFGATVDPPLVMVQSAPGRFEIAASDSAVAHRIAATAEEAWRWLSGPLALPEAFPSPIFLRVVPGSIAENRLTPFAVTVEVGGIVSARVRADAVNAGYVPRVLVQTLLMRLAVARNGVSERLTAPLWLEHACVGWWQTRAVAAQLDALKQEAERATPPRLEALLGWQRGGDESRPFSAGATWLLAFLQAESGRNREWPALLLRLLNGEEPLAALAAAFPGRFNSAEERELWWQTGYHHVRRTRTLPVFDAEESRAQLAALARFVFGGPTEDVDVIVPLVRVVAAAADPIVGAEIMRREAELAKLLPAVHPFFRNAGLSLTDAFAARTLPAAKRDAAVAAFEQDWRDALELEAASRAALDRLEAQMSTLGRR